MISGGFAFFIGFFCFVMGMVVMALIIFIPPLFDWLFYGGPHGR